MNNIMIRGKIEVSDIQKKDDKFFINGFINEEAQKLKFTYVTIDENEVFKFQNLCKETLYEVDGDVLVKYKRYNFTSINVHGIRDNGEIII